MSYELDGLTSMGHNAYVSDGHKLHRPHVWTVQESHKVQVKGVACCSPSWVTMTFVRSGPRGGRMSVLSVNTGQGRFASEVHLETHSDPPESNLSQPATLWPLIGRLKAEHLWEIFADNHSNTCGIFKLKSLLFCPLSDSRATCGTHGLHRQVLRTVQPYSWGLSSKIYLNSDHCTDTQTNQNRFHNSYTTTTLKMQFLSISCTGKGKTPPRHPIDPPSASDGANLHRSCTNKITMEGSASLMNKWPLIGSYAMHELFNKSSHRWKHNEFYASS